MSLFGRIVRWPLRIVPRQAVMRVLSGPLRGTRWIAGAATHGCWIGTYERLAQRVFCEHVRPGDVVYDIGANAGFFTLLAARLTGPAGVVYAFEPLERNQRFLAEHLRVNGVTNVRVLPLAVSDREATLRFASAANPAMGGLSDAGELEVRAVSLDALVARGEIRPPSFIKMDIEGGEHGALTGATATLRTALPTILLSAHGIGQHQRCEALLTSRGYCVDLLVDGTADGNYVVLARPRRDS